MPLNKLGRHSTVLTKPTTVFERVKVKNKL